MDADEKLWRQYTSHVDLYKHHLELLLKFTAYYYAITGAIISYYLSRQESQFLVYSLRYPIFVSFIYGWVFLYAARTVEADLIAITEVRHSLGLISGREMHFLPFALKISGCLFLFTSLSLVALFIAAIIGYDILYKPKPSPSFDTPVTIENTP